MTFTKLLLIAFILTCIKLHSQIPENLQNTNWKQQGYDRILKISDSTYSYFNSNEYVCSVLVKGNFEGRFKIIEFSDNQLILNPGGIVNYRFERIDSIPENCSEKNIQVGTFETNFNSFWKTFNDNYAFFEKRNLNWKNIYERYLPVVRNLKSEKEFSLVLKEIIEKFDDGHIRLEVPDSVLKNENQTPSEVNPISKDQILSALTNKYIENSKSYNNGVLRWGMLKNTNTGYIAVTDMNNFANYVSEEVQTPSKFDSIFDNKRSSKKPLEYFQDEVDGADQIMTDILNDFRKTKSIIVDLRFNGGGFETVALELLSHFVNQEKEILSIKAKIANGFSPIQHYSIKPKTKEAKKIYLLISPHTASAAEIFALGSLSYSNFERYGSRSAGIFSEILWKELPIGWEYSLSNEVYLDKNGNSYEGEGIPVDYDLKYSKDRIEFYNNFYSNNDFSDFALEKITASESEN